MERSITKGRTSKKDKINKYRKATPKEQERIVRLAMRKLGYE